MIERSSEPDVEPVRDGRNSGMESKKRQKRGRIEEQSGKVAMRLHSEKHVCPRRRNPTALKTILSSRQTERDGKAFWDAEQSDGHPARCWGSRVASEPLCPREARVGTLRAGKNHLRFAWRSCGGGRQAPPPAVVSREPPAGAPAAPAAPNPQKAAAPGPTGAA